jgi:molecular chaperone GrpE
MNDDAQDQGNEPGTARTGAPPIDDGAAIPTPASALEAEVAALRTEVATLKDQLLRALAETENVRRRAQRDKDDAGKFAISNFAREIVQVADNLRRALEAIPAEALASDEALRSLHEGVLATERQFEQSLERQAIAKIWPMGERFDSNLHQAMFEVPGTGQPQGTIVQVLQAGYTLHERLLRPAMVAVAKGDGQSAGGDGPVGGNVDTVA